MIFFKCIILVNKWTHTFNQLSHFQVWNSWDAPGKGNCIRLYTTGILNREMSLPALQFCSWISCAQSGKSKILCPVLPFQISRFLNLLQKNVKAISMAEIPLTTFHCALTDILQEDKVNCFSQPAGWSITMCYWGTPENSSM